MAPVVNISIKILPCNNFNYDINNQTALPEKENEEIVMPKYIEPLNTYIERVEISFEDSDSYIIPQTTC